MQIRVVKTNDAASIREIYAPHIEQGVTSFETEVPGVDYFRNLIQQTIRQHPWLVAEDDGQVVGYAYASEHASRAAYRWSVNTSIYIDADHQRQGAGRRLYERLFPILREQGYRMAHAGITLPNAASVGLHESFDFRPIGVYQNVGFKLGEWLDVGWWALDLLPGNASPSEPIPFPALQTG